MKKIIFSFILLFCLLANAQSQIVITEIMYNPPESGTDSLEYIEILNTSNATINMAGWSLEFGTTTITAFAITDLSISAGQYKLFSVNSAAIQNNFGKASLQWTTGGLNNNGATIRIKNAAAATIDEVVYDDVAPWPTQPDGMGSSLVLCDPASDNSVGSNWSSAATLANITINGFPVYANPGAASGCLVGLVAIPDVAFVVPDQATFIDVVNNDNIPAGSTATEITIVSGPSHGVATVASDTSIRYLPNAGFCGQDILTYQVCDAPGSCSTATVTLNVKCYAARTIEQMNNINTNGVADSVNVSCELTGIVYGVNLRASGGGSQFALLNESGSEGISTFRGLGDLGYVVKEGDKVKIRGSIAQFNGLTQINMDTVIKVNSGNTLVTPPVVLKVDESTESRLVKIKNLRYANIAQWTPGVGSGFTVRVYSPTNPSDTIAMRIDNDIDLFNQVTPPTEPFDVIGIGGQFDASNPFTSGYQFGPRYTADILTGVSTSLVDYSASISVSPNPMKDLMRIQTTVAFDRISVFGANGQLVTMLQNPSLNEEVNLSGLPAGVYAVRFEKNNTIWTAAAIKM